MVVQVKAVIPPKLNPEVFEQEIGDALEEEGGILKRMYEKTTRTWKTNVEFDIETSQQSPGPRGGKSSKTARVEVTTDSDVFLWVDQGTAPHIIRPKRPGRRLRFRVGGFKPKTKVRTIGSGKGKAGRDWVSPDQVRHPGTKARKFTQEIEKRRRRPFFKKMNAAIQRANRKAFRGKRRV